ncbi:MAG: helix-turn-helix transcriptional regulator, partial [Aestuariivirga sp.]
KTCARMLEEFKWQLGVTRRVYDELTRTPGRFPEIEDVASALCMTSRTLRRKLEAEGTSYSELLDSVRRALATDYLKASVLDTEDIAAALGFCDGASFRRAYKRWTGSSPSQLRSRAGGLPRHIGLSAMAPPLSASGLSSHPRGRR